LRGPMEGRRLKGEGPSRNGPRLVRERAVGKPAAMSFQSGTRTLMFLMSSEGRPRKAPKDRSVGDRIKIDIGRRVEKTKALGS
jgi:hypothetical protein